MLFGLSVMVGSHFIRPKQTATDQPPDVGEAAIPARDVFVMPRANRSIPPAEPLAAASESERTRTADSGRFMTVPATAKMESDSQPDTISPLPARRSPVAQCAEELQQPTFDPYAESPSSLVDQSAPQSSLPDPPQLSIREGDTEGEESSVWAITLIELRASFELFETQIAQPLVDGPVDDGSISPPVSDSFDQELYRMENSLRLLEFGSTDMLDHRANLVPKLD
jgi:hypothetical protein